MDEAFLPFLADEAAHSLAGARPPNVIVLRSLTKHFTLPGLRLGYLVANKDRASQFCSIQPWWPIGVLTQLAGIAALNDKAFVRRTKAWLNPERKWFLQQLRLFFPHLQPVASEAPRSAISGVLPMAPTIPLRVCMRAAVRLRREGEAT